MRPHVIRRLAAGLLSASIASCASAPASSPIATPSPRAAASVSPSPAGQSASPGGSAVAIDLPVFERDEPLVLCARLTDAGGGLFVMRPNGTGRAQLATDILPGVHKRGDWSPDGQSVVFIDETTERMWIAHLDGSPSVAVPACDDPGCDFPSWSPDGKRIVFSRSEGGPVVGPAALGIYVVEVATKEATKAVRLERPLLADAPRWSPDGDQIVFHIERMDADAFGRPARAAESMARFEMGHLASTGPIRPDRPQVPRPLVGRELALGFEELDRVHALIRLPVPVREPTELLEVVDPSTGAITPFATPGVEARPVLRPIS